MNLLSFRLKPIPLIRIIVPAALVIAGAGLAGCMSRSAAGAQARAAYLAGQRDAIAQLSTPAAGAAQAAVPNLPSNITIIGPVEHPVIAWQDGLTLAQAILAAVYHSTTDPNMILIRRSTEEINVDPARLLGGSDIPLRPGDIVILQLP